METDWLLFRQARKKKDLSNQLSVFLTFRFLFLSPSQMNSCGLWNVASDTRGEPISSQNPKWHLDIDGAAESRKRHWFIPTHIERPVAVIEPPTSSICSDRTAQSNKCTRSPVLVQYGASYTGLIKWGGRGPRWAAANPGWLSSQRKTWLLVCILLNREILKSLGRNIIMDENERLGSRSSWRKILLDWM